MTAQNNPPPTLKEIELKLNHHVLLCAFSRKNYEDKIAANTHDLKLIDNLYQKMIEEIREQICTTEEMLTQVAPYKYNKTLKGRMERELERQNKRIEESHLQLNLFHKTPQELLKQAKQDKFSALFIIQTPPLIAQIPDNQLEYITHQNNEIIKKLASLLASHEYTPTIAKIYATFTQQVSDEKDKNFVMNQENKVIKSLLLSINNYLDKKIKQSLNPLSTSWSLGYFGSRYKWHSNNKKLPIPQGIYELKSHLALLEKRPPKEILNRIQSTLKTKLEEIHDDTFFQQVKRFVSYLFGYYRHQNTIKDYEYLNELCLGKK